MDWKYWIVIIVLFAIGIIVFAVGTSKSDQCLDNCKTSRNLLIASNVFFVITAMIFIYGMSGYCGRHALSVSNFFFIISALLFGLGIGMGTGQQDNCVGDCKKGIDMLIGSNAIFIATGLLAAFFMASGNDDFVCWQSKVYKTE